MSCANSSSASASLPPASALPPYLTTTTLPGEAPDVGQRLDEDGGLLGRRPTRAGAHGSSPTVRQAGGLGQPERDVGRLQRAAATRPW